MTNLEAAWGAVVRPVLSALAQPGIRFGIARAAATFYPLKRTEAA